MSKTVFAVGDGYRIHGLFSAKKLAQEYCLRAMESMHLERTVSDDGMCYSCGLKGYGSVVKYAIRPIELDKKIPLSLRARERRELLSLFDSIAEAGDDE